MAVNNSEVLKKISELKGQKDSVEDVVSMAFYEPSVAEGVYTSVISKAVLEKNAVSKLGINDKIIITHTILISTAFGITEEVDLRQVLWKSVSQNSAYYRFLSPLLGKDPRDGFNINELIGIPCQVTVTHYQSDKGRFAGITDLSRLELDEEFEELII